LAANLATALALVGGSLRKCPYIFQIKTNLVYLSSGKADCGCYEKAINYYGYDTEAPYAIENIQIAEECQFECAKRDYCSHFSFNAISKECFLKYGVTEESRVPGGPEVWSGPARCP